MKKEQQPPTIYLPAASCNVIRNSSQDSAWQQLAAAPLPARLLLLVLVLPTFTTQLSFIDPFQKLSILRTTPIMLVLVLVAIFPLGCCDHIIFCYLSATHKWMLLSRNNRNNRIVTSDFSLVLKYTRHQSMSQLSVLSPQKQMQNLPKTQNKKKVGNKQN
jgi:hypothetical protein